MAVGACPALADGRAVYILTVLTSLTYRSKVWPQVGGALRNGQTVRLKAGIADAPQIVEMQGKTVSPQLYGRDFLPSVIIPEALRVDAA